MDYQSYKGTEDKFGERLFVWHYVENVIKKLCEDFGFSEIRTPTFEYTDVFTRGVGEGTDIVQKEMFSFLDRGGRSLTLRPELTAGVARAFVEHGMSNLPQPTKLFYVSNCFRAERPQKGRDIEFFQFGVEYLGSPNPAVEAEVMCVGHELFKRLGMKNVKLFINSLGGPICRERYNSALKDFVRLNFEKLCPTCQERSKKNTLRILDCKSPTCKEILKDAPKPLDVLDDSCLEHFEGVKMSLANLGVDYEIDPSLVRGIDYYTRTVFEFIPQDNESAMSTILGGGRYDNLIEGYGGQPTPAVGFGMGIGRLVAELEKQDLLPEYAPAFDIYIGSAGDEGRALSARLALDLRRIGVKAEYDTIDRSVKSQMKYADKIKAKTTMVIGENEIDEGKAKLKLMNSDKTDLEVLLCAETIKKLLTDLE